uniref:Histone acetyltransferase type B catalytic subunit n=1 Tax=Angiostrongylus cantonensis TaxID=6313 RepID=A0A0K0DF12_ANGCA
MVQDNVLAASGSRFVANALETVWIRFSKRFFNTESETDADGYHPEFAHQYFGDKEIIYGYENLRLILHYTDASMFLYPEFSFSTAEDDIMGKLKSQLPCDQMNMMVESREEFKILLLKQKKFKPFGELIIKFTKKLFKETIITFESRGHEAGDGSRAYSFAGYASLYRFYAYPDRIRPRFAQIMLLPQYRKNGIGAKLLNAICKDLCSLTEVLDITVEDPADNFIYLRDYVDCLNCSKLPEFSPEKLKGGFSMEMKKIALEKLKITKRQSRRVYEILRLKSTNMKDADEAKAYRLDVKRRLEVPMKRNERDWKKIQRALNDSEYAKLQQLYEAEVESYKLTIERMILYPNI